MTPNQQRKVEKIFGSLTLINRFGWLRAGTIGRFMWLGINSAHMMGMQLCQTLSDEKLVLARTLPNGAGKAYVLSDKGAKFLRDADVEAKTGKDWGAMKEGKWTPPSSWIHDLWAQEVVAWLFANTEKPVQEFMTEREIESNINSHTNPLSKYPDALIRFADGKDCWLEVERARKTGAPMNNLVHECTKIMRGGANDILGFKPTQVMFAVPIDFREPGTGHVVNHRTKLINGFKRYIRKDCAALLVEFETKGMGATNFRLSEPLFIPADLVSVRLARLETQIKLDKLSQNPDPGATRTWHLNKIELASDERGNVTEWLNAELHDYDARPGRPACGVLEVQRIVEPSRLSGDAPVNEVYYPRTVCASLSAAKRQLASVLQTWADSKARNRVHAT